MEKNENNNKKENKKQQEKKSTKINLIVPIIFLFLGYFLNIFISKINNKPKKVESIPEKKEIKFCTAGGCAAKLGPKVLERILSRLPKGKKDENLLVGYESSDDASVYKITENIATIQTVDFFPPMIEDPYTFGKIAAANALSDVYAMGGKPITALNIVCFPMNWDLNILGKIMQGGNEKVIEAGASIVGGHSINDNEVKYGLSVTGLVNPKKILKNYGAKIGDKLILTKPLGVGITTTAKKKNIIKQGDYEKMILSMTTLNKYASEILLKYNCHALTDVTGFGLLVHSSEMMHNDVSCNIHVNQIPLLNKNLKYYIEKGMITGASSRNEDAVKNITEFKLKKEDEWYKYLLLDPQTNGGLLCSIDNRDAQNALNELNKLELESNIVGEVIKKKEKIIYID